MDSKALITALKQARVKHEDIAKALGRSRPVAVQIMNFKRPLKADEVPKLVPLLPTFTEFTGNASFIETNLHQDGQYDYLPVPVLPAKAGMGGGGYVENDEPARVLMHRGIIERALHGRPNDFIVVHAKGDSMEPDFFHGDQLLVDRRDTSPIQPGPFAIRIDDMYVVKNVEVTREGLRVFSSNPKYSNEWFPPEEVQIIGRPVWVGRLL